MFGKKSGSFAKGGSQHLEIPEPPTADQILEDIDGAPDDDVAFSVVRRTERISLMEEMDCSDDPCRSPVSPGIDTSQQVAAGEVEASYLKVKQYINSCGHLNSQVDLMNTKLDQLKGSEASLKSAVQAAMVSNEKKTG